MRALRICIGMTKFLFSPNISMKKMQNLGRYSSLYIRMLSKNEDDRKRNYMQWTKTEKQQKQQRSLKMQLQKTKRKLREKIQNIKATGKKEYENMSSGKIQQGIKAYVGQGFQYLSLYYESLQSLVEGKRQVLHNPDFKFEDGESVKEKQKKAEAIFLKIVGKKPKADDNQLG